MCGQGPVLEISGTSFTLDSKGKFLLGAKGADGKSLDDLKGKALRLGPRDKAAEFEKFDGKNVEVAGSVGEGRRPGTKVLRVDSIK